MILFKKVSERRGQKIYLSLIFFSEIVRARTGAIW